MRSTSRLATVLAALALAASLPRPALARAQFGPLPQKLHVPFSAFQPRYPGTFISAAQFGPSGGFIDPVSGGPGTATMMAPLDESKLPKGARITSIRAFIRDASLALDEDMVVALCRTWTDVQSGLDPDGDCPVVMVSTVGLPPFGDGFLFEAADHTVDYTANVDIDGLTEEVSYSLIVDFGAATLARAYFGDDLRLYQVVITFEREISPPTGFPTFDDVGVDAEEYAHVEALAAAGITDGCTPFNFCPDAPVTRRQLAVFLARALGLHWGNF